MKDKNSTGLLAFFLGGLGVHRFYLGQTGLGILYLVFCWTFIPMVVAFVDAIIFWTQSKESFDAKYNQGQMASSPQVDAQIVPGRATHFYPNLAGFQYYNAPTLISELHPGTPVSLLREPHNEHDPNAIGVYYKNQKLGFLPSEWANSFYKQMDRGDILDAKVYAYNPEESDYRKLTLELIDSTYFSKVRQVIKSDAD